MFGNLSQTQRILAGSVAALAVLGLILGILLLGDCECGAGTPTTTTFTVEYICPSSSSLVIGDTAVVEVYLYGADSEPGGLEWVLAKSAGGDASLDGVIGTPGESTRKSITNWQPRVGPSGNNSYWASVEVEGISVGQVSVCVWSSDIGIEPVENTPDRCTFYVVTELAPPNLVITGLSVTPSVVGPGVPVTIEVTVENTGDLTGDRQIELSIEGRTEATRNVTLAGHASTTESFTVSRDEVRIYTVEVNGSTGQFEVVSTRYELTVNSSTGGSVITPGEGSFTYNAGEVVNLVAEADEGWHFDRWGGDAVADPYSAATTITMDADKTVTANFSEGPAIPNLSGVWRLEVFDINSTCGPEPDWSSTITIVQEGNSLEVTGIKGTTFIVTGSVVGDTVTIGPGDFPEEGGTTTATYIMTIVSDTLMEGREEWTWTDFVSICSNGTATIRATRID